MWGGLHGGLHGGVGIDVPKNVLDDDEGWLVLVAAVISRTREGESSCSP
jgi:hypothetical protein